MLATRYHTDPVDGAHAPDIRRVLTRLLEVRRAAVAAEAAIREEIDPLPADQRQSAANLAHYLTLRRFDLRVEQRILAGLGLSSLGRAEAHVLHTLDAVIARLARDVDHVDLPDDLERRGPSAASAASLLADRSDQVLGPRSVDHATRVMVTLPSFASDDPNLVSDLVEAGMGLARINCAHEGPAQWTAMAARVREAADLGDQKCRVVFDLPGRAVRTGALEPAPEVIRARPRRDPLGQVLDPARVRFVAQPLNEAAGGVDDSDDVDVLIPVEASVLRGAREGDELMVVDGRGRKRRFPVVSVSADGVETTSDRTTYFVSGLAVRRRRRGEVIAEGKLGTLPRTVPAVVLRAGDLLELRLGREPGAGRRPHDPAPAHFGVDTPELFERLQPGHRVLFDDGRIEGSVTAVSADTVRLRIVRPSSAKLKAGKGLSCPDVVLDLPALTDSDLTTLELVAPLADAVALSFAHGPEDVDRMHHELDRVGADNLGLILKIEDREGFETLPQMLQRALRRTPTAVMIARGDLAAEIGFDRLAEVQEEILSLAAAAHIPVIWATQVLDSLSKNGLPTRAEVTDAAASGRSECVMLNKGPHTLDAIGFLDDVLTRMDGHQAKRTPLLRRLAVADLAPGGRPTNQTPG